MTFKTKIKFAEYRNVAYTAAFNSWRARILIFLIGFSLFSSIVELLKPTQFAHNPLMQLLVTIGVILILTIVTYATIRRNYYSNAIISETVEYTINEDVVFVQGESFKSEWSLNKVYKTEELKKWFLIYHSARSFTFIPKSILTANQVSELRHILNNAKR